MTNTSKEEIHPFWFAKDTLRETSQKGNVLAWYKFRYIAFPIDALERAAGISIDNFSEDKSEVEYLEFENTFGEIYNSIIGRTDEDIQHELGHHHALQTSSFWIYVNLCETVRRLLFISSSIRKRMYRRTMKALFMLHCEKTFIRRCVISLEEHRQALADNKLSHIDIAYKNHTDTNKIITMYHDLDALKISFRMANRIFPDDIINNSQYDKFLFLRTLIVFLRRNLIYFIMDVPTMIFRLLHPKVFWSFTRVLLLSLFRYSEIVDLPGFRTFKDDGEQVAFDPGSQFGGRAIRCDPLELKMAPIEFKAYDEDAKWFNYLVEKKAWVELLGRGIYRDRMDYEFLCKWLYGKPDLWSEVHNFDRLCFETIKKYAIFENSPNLWLEKALNWIKIKRRNRYSNLSEKQVYTIIDASYLHGL